MTDDALDLERFRNYLLLMARSHMSSQLLGKLDPADIVQQTLIEGHGKRDQNLHRTEAELMAWLRLLLAHQIVAAARSFGRAKRDISREKSLEAELDASSKNLRQWLAADQTSPSMRAHRHEAELRLADALAQLPDKQRDTLILRHMHGWTFAQIAKHLGCMPNAVVGFLNRGGQRLRELLTED